MSFTSLIAVIPFRFIYWYNIISSISPYSYNIILFSSTKNFHFNEKQFTKQKQFIVGVKWMRLRRNERELLVMAGAQPSTAEAPTPWNLFNFLPFGSLGLHLASFTITFHQSFKFKDKKVYLFILIIDSIGDLFILLCE